MQEDRAAWVSGSRSALPSGRGSDLNLKKACCPEATLNPIYEYGLSPTR